MHRALVTGATGFVGQALVKQLRARSVAVHTIGTRSTGDSRHFAFGNAGWTEAQWRDAIEKSKPEIIYHLAGKFRGAPADLEMVNFGLVSTLLPVLEALETRPSLIVAGSAAEYGGAFIDGVPTTEELPCQPVIGTYGNAKHAQTKAVLAYGARTGSRAIVARVFNTIGAGMPKTLALGDFANQIAAMSPSGGTIHTGNLDVARDFISIDAVIDILVRLGDMPEADGLINICSGEAFYLRPLVERMIARSGKPISLQVDPTRLRPGEPKVIIGSTAHLASLGIQPPVEDVDALSDAILDYAAERVTAEA